MKNYLPYQRNFDTLVYVHKRVFEQDEAEQEARVKKIKAEKKKLESHNTRIENSGRSRNETVLEQTVRFAKNIAPIVIPNTDENVPIFYTVETCSKCRKRDKGKKPKEIPSCNTYKKHTCKKIIETFRKEEQLKRDIKNMSNSESTSHISSNTFDDLNMNQSLSCTLTEQSEKRVKSIKNDVNAKRRKRVHKCVISESFEAVAEELANADDTKIKIHMMNNAEKNAFCDSIKAPVLNAIKDCMLEFEGNEINEEVKTMKRMVKNNMSKIDLILDKLTSIEQQLNRKIIDEPHPVKESTLEQLGADIEMEEKSFEEEFEGIHRPKEHEDNKVEDMGCGELGKKRSSTSVGVKTEKANRLPARFCWTDAKKS